MADPSARLTDSTAHIKENAWPALFISHAAPDDNAFALWLGAKLGARGYEVWADVLRLRGGDDVKGTELSRIELTHHTLRYQGARPAQPYEALRQNRRRDIW